MASSEADRFGPQPATYDALVHWQRRLKREAPFYRRLFERVGVRRVLDAACGTGRHAEMFHSWGLTVEGADASRDMLDYCQRRCEASETLRWVQRPFQQPAEPRASFDCVICVGNSLAIAPDSEAVAAALSAMIASIRPAGALVVQMLNLWRLAEGSLVWQKCKRIQDDDGDRILLKGVHRLGGRGCVEIATLDLSSDDVTSHFRSATLLGIERDDLIELARKAGASECSTYGGYDESPYDRDQSTDLILVARRSVGVESV